VNYLQNYLAGLDGAQGGYESLDGPAAKVVAPKGNPIQRNALQPAAQFTTRLTRLTNAVANGAPLPLALFGWNKYFSQYVGDLSNSQNLPANTSYNGVIGGLVQAATPSIALADRLQFQYTEGANVDLLQIECDENPYTEVLSATAFTPMLVNKIRMSLSNETQNSQFNQGIKIIRSSTFGKVETQTIVPATQKSPMQFQQGIVDLIDFPLVVDAQTYMIVPIIGQAAFAVAMSFEVQAFSRPLNA